MFNYNTLSEMRSQSASNINLPSITWLINKTQLRDKTTAITFQFSFASLYYQECKLAALRLHAYIT